MSQNELITLFQFDPDKLDGNKCAQKLRDIFLWLRGDIAYYRSKRPLSHLRRQTLFFDLDQDIDKKKKLHRLLVRIFESFDLSTLMTQTGLSDPHGIFREFLMRCIDKVLPRHSAQLNLKDLIFLLFHHEQDVIFVRNLSSKEVDQFFQLLDPELSDPEKGRNYLNLIFRQHLLRSIEVLAAKLLVISESPTMSDRRWKNGKPLSNPFQNLFHSTLECLHGGIRDSKSFHNCLRVCEKALDRYLSDIEEHSVSVDLVYQIEVSTILLHRIELLIFALIFEDSATPHSLDKYFFANLIEEEQHRRSVRHLLGQNMHYLARKVVERSGDTGDHYIARNADEKHVLFVAALGGGALTALTSLFKILIHNMGLALFFEGFFSSVNYSGSFVIMQFTHLTLATKQPAMTAAALSKKMRAEATDPQELKLEIKNLFKSQLLTATGNLCAVVPCACAIAMIYAWITGHPWLTPEEAEHVIAGHNPFALSTFLYAVLTGIILWTASVVHGYVENWIVFRALPEAISDSFTLIPLVGIETRQRISNWLKKNLAGVLANIALGTMLAFTPVVGSFFGFPLEVRHVTLATGSLTIAWASMPVESLDYKLILTGFGGVMVILLGNLLTSFVLSLTLASRAKGESISHVMKYFKLAFKK